MHVYIILESSFEMSIKFLSLSELFICCLFGTIMGFLSLFVIFSLTEFHFLSSIHSFCCYHMLLEQS